MGKCGLLIKGNGELRDMEKIFEEVISGRLVMNEEGEFVRREKGKKWKEIKKREGEGQLNKL